jgi:hypothetical protein
MKTEVIMKRRLFGNEISQKSQSEMFSATDLVKAGNMWRIANGLSPFDSKAWFKNKSTTEFVSELEIKYGKVKVSGRGKGSHTWVHPLLFIDMALAINPKLKVEVYEWLFDNLIKFRNESGDSYKKMCGNLYANQGDKRNFPAFVSDVANKVKLACRVNDWNKATEDQLNKRDKIHNNIALLSDVLRNNDQAVRIGILKAID